MDSSDKLPQLELKIADLSRGGAGVGRDESGRVIFVPFTAPGDRVRVEIIEESKNYAQGRLLELLEASPVRQKAPCPVFGRCGGCQWQHLPYEVQWKTKVGGVKHALARVGVALPAEPGSFAALPAERVWEYRNRVQARGEGELMGFFAAGSHDLVPIDRCYIARPEINAVWNEVRHDGAARFARGYKVELEAMPDGSVRKFWNARHGAGGFRQVHDEQNARLQEWVATALSSGRELLDLFGGAGNLSVPLASRMRAIHVVDVSAPVSAPEGVPNHVKFHRSPVMTWLMRYARAAETGGERAAILDPPREGLGRERGEILALLRKLEVRELVAVGCDADAWARDVLAYLQAGWRLDRLAALDLFPQTPHVESIAVLSRG